MIITMFLMLGIWSCGTRKTNKTEEKIQVTKKDTTEIVINTGKVENKIEVETTKTNEISNWDFNHGTVSPVDPEKPMTHTGPDGKTNTYTNTKIEFGKGSGSSTKHTETAKEIKTETKDTSAAIINSGSSEVIKKETTKKETDRKGVGSNIWFWVGIAIASCIVLWFLWFVIIRKKKQEENELL